MEPYHVQGAVTLDCGLGDDGMIYLRMGGNISEDTLPLMQEWAEKVREAMRTAKAANPERVLTLIEVMGSVEADPKSIAILHELMAYNRDYATRTAVFGASFFTRQIVDIAIHVTGRTNMRQFDSKEDALMWLFGGEV